MAKSGFYLAVNGDASPSPPPVHRIGHLARSSTLLEVQELARHHDSLSLSQRYGHVRKSEKDLKSLKKGLREYYEAVNQQLDYFEEIDDLLAETEPAVSHQLAHEGTALLPLHRKSKVEKEQEQRRKDNIAINVNFAVNVVLLAAKVLVVLFSNSLSLLASAVDSFMDFLSTCIIFFTARASGTRDVYNYPAGKSRIEPVGIAIFSVLMVAAFFQVFVEAVQRLFEKNLSIVDLSITSIVAMSVTVAVKLVVFVAYRSFESASVRALSQDAKNDIVFNAFSLLFPFLERWTHFVYLDPLGAMALSIYIIVEWVETLYECVRDLVGKRAEPLQHQRIIYLTTRFSPLVKAVRYCNVYSAGGGMIVEIDVLLPKDCSLPKAHDICELIQNSIENLEGVNRAYVHADYNIENPAGHQVR